MKNGEFSSNPPSQSSRDQVKWRDLTPLLRPRTVAVVGVSAKSSARGNGVIRNLKDFGFSGRSFPMNPKYPEVMGLPCYPNFTAIPEPADCTVLAIPASSVPDLLLSAVDNGIRAAVVLSSGFGEAGPEGQARQAQLEALSRDRGFLICGPNCWGILNVHDKIALFSGGIPKEFLPGDVALVSQSGGLSMLIAKPLVAHGVGFSYLVSCGNQAGVTVEEYINYFIDDERTRVIAGFVEGFKRPKTLAELARKALDRNKPIIIMKVGKSDVAQQATLAHTGSLAGSAEVVEAVFRQNGIVQVHSLNEMVETVALFTSRSVRARFAGGKRLGVLTSRGGICTHISDVAIEAGLELPDLAETTKARLKEVLPDFGTPRNPLDGTGAVNEDTKIFTPLLKALVDDPNVDLVAINITGSDAGENSRRFVEQTAQIAPTVSKPLVVFSSVAGGALDRDIIQPLRAVDVPFMDGADWAMSACRNLVRYYEFCQSARRETVSSQESDASRAFELPSGILPTPAAFKLVEAFGIPVAPNGLVQTADEAVAVATQVGFPVALKVESPDIQHKNDVGGVVLGIPTPEAVRESFRRMRQEVKTRAPAAKITGILVQRMAGEGVEVILGIKKDPWFGPVIVCGLGGIFVEILRDVAIGIPPLSQEQARNLIGRLRGRPILQGARGRPPGDTEALVKAIVCLSRLALATKDRLTALDINPLIVLPEGSGVLAVDALVQVQ